MEFLAITEHWQDQEQLSAYNMQEYMLISSYCRSRNKHGGSAIYVRNCLAVNCKSRDDIVQMSISQILECSALEYCASGSNKLAP